MEIRDLEKELAETKSVEGANEKIDAVFDRYLSSEEGIQSREDVLNFIIDEVKVFEDVLNDGLTVMQIIACCRDLTQTGKYQEMNERFENEFQHVIAELGFKFAENKVINNLIEKYMDTEDYLLNEEDVKVAFVEVKNICEEAKKENY